MDSEPSSLLQYIEPKTRVVNVNHQPFLQVMSGRFDDTETVEWSNGRRDTRDKAKGW